MLFFVTATNPDIIQCSSLHMCKRDRYYHVECIGLDMEVTASGDWYCSAECKAHISYCCNQQKPETAEHVWVGCDSAGDCAGGEWYHLSCLNLKTIPLGNSDHLFSHYISNTSSSNQTLG